MSTRIATILSAFLLAAAIATGGRAAALDHRQLASRFLDGFMRPGAAELADRAAELRTALAQLCSAADVASLEHARALFAAAAFAYLRIEAVRFGPSRDHSRQERLLFFPDPKGLVRRQVEKALASREAALLDAEALYGRSVALQGFPALELMLHGADLTAGDDASRFRCGYAAAIGANIARVAADIAREWSDGGGYARLMLEPSAENPAYLDGKEVSLEIMQAFLTGLEALRDNRLAAPAGLRGPEKAPTPALLETSGLALPAVAAGLDGLAALWRTGGLEPIAKAYDRARAKVIDQELETVRRGLARIKGDIAAVRRGGPARQGIVALGFPLKNARQLAAEVLGEATGLSIGFNAGDGD